MLGKTKEKLCLSISWPLSQPYKMLGCNEYLIQSCSSAIDEIWSLDCMTTEILELALQVHPSLSFPCLNLWETFFFSIRFSISTAYYESWVVDKIY